MANLIRRTEPGAWEPARMLDPFEMMRELMLWEPLRDLAVPAARGLAFAPSFDVKETKDGYLFKADLPGVKEKDLEIALTGNRLTVSGRREEEKKEEGERFYTWERSSGAFTRTFTLPEGVDADHAQAELKEGVLTISIAKRPEVKARKIELKTLKPGEKAHA